jgi:hypothetical protein
MSRGDFIHYLPSNEILADTLFLLRPDAGRFLLQQAGQKGQKDLL